jgi:hypothetical protein
MRSIARYRLAHPRKHTAPLDDNFKRLIDAFVEKYKLNGKINLRLDSAGPEGGADTMREFSLQE